MKEKLLAQKEDRNTSVLNVHYQLASTYGPVHLSLYVAEGARQGLVNPVSDDSFCAVLHQQLCAQHPIQPCIVSTLSQQSRK